VLKLIEEQGKLNDDILKALKSAKTLTEVEDIYRPYKQKKRTRATMALERGLKPLAAIISGGEFKGDVNSEAVKFIIEEKDVSSIEDAINGALDIIAEEISDEAKYRKWIRELVFKEGKIQSTGESDEHTPFEMYYEYGEEISKIPPHRILAINRG
ncbi:RNA-binding transcriptional accessory protein, partial [Clostridium perfringens]